MNIIVKNFAVLIFCCLFAAPAYAEKITVAAAADLKFAMNEIVAKFNNSHKGAEVEIVYGSSGKFQTQIQQGAPYDLFFSADISYPRELARLGLAGSEVIPYAVGRIVLWSNRMDAEKLTLESLLDPKITRIAIANPKHAPYGKRAEEALKSLGLLEKVQDKLVLGENIAQTAQFVQTGNAQIGIIALSLVMNPELSKNGGYSLIPEKLHEPLQQGFIITKKGEEKGLSKRFANYMQSDAARAVMVNYGFVLPKESLGE